ncbi:branched-chain amino acid ABC transporter permease [Gordonia sp. HNM0687]|uniref:Branched-chain amino acid ABC transporter permease n=1 Tax=Gordonia mangrovi TaxID=2665643 RepID=A0A6L7GW64_9ACTN|nr:branched-chain amino acid ABC transporter permease [Gordonia mangrovi]MXP24239.1 branched-chain amino acid ABC transporter permease [Gordonia mangrovi]UVF79940.1 branched-chain amino acid ABC transporter permease [Gordonia mangrovi]
MTTWIDANAVLLQQTLTTLLMALSIQIPMRMGVFSFAGIGAFGIGGYSAAAAMIHLEWGTIPAIALGVVISGVVVYLLGLVVQRLSGLYMGMATIAFTLIIAVIAVNGGEVTGGASGLFGALGNLTLGGIFVIVVLVVILTQLTESGGLGRRIDAVREDPELANAMGINVNHYRRLSFLASGLVGGLAGGLTTLLRSTITPEEVNFHLVVLALTVIVVGGMRSWVGVLIGSVIFVWLPTWVHFVSEWEEFIYGLLVVLAAVFLPDGILGILRNLWHTVRAKQKPPTKKPAADRHDKPTADPDREALEVAER